MKLKVLTVILSVILFFSCIPFSASAFMIWEEDTANLYECGDYTYELMSDGKDVLLLRKYIVGLVEFLG